MTVSPSGLRHWLEAPVRKDMCSDHAGVNYLFMLTLSYVKCLAKFVVKEIPYKVKVVIRGNPLQR